MVHSGAVVSFLAADLHSAAALLDRFLVHLTSASMYPLFAWLRRSPLERRVFEGRTFLRVWSFGAMGGILMLGAAAQFAGYGDELLWARQDRSVDQGFIRHMSTHHEQGILLASMAAERAGDPHLRALSKLMAASQGGETRILAHWWTSWFDEPMQTCSAQERAAMPGLLDAADLAKLQSIEASSFDGLFVDLMTRHHKGAVAMADALLRGQSDPRLMIMAHAIRHAQQGEIALMHGIHGVPAVSLAIQHMFADRVNRSPGD